MFEIERKADGCYRLVGRFDASQEEKAKQILDAVHDSCTLDFEELRYISSAGLGILVALQLRLSKENKAVRLRNLSPHIRELFRMAGLDRIFEIDPPLEP